MKANTSLNHALSQDSKLCASSGVKIESFSSVSLLPEELEADCVPLFEAFFSLVSDSYASYDQAKV